MPFHAILAPRWATRAALLETAPSINSAAPGRFRDPGPNRCRRRPHAVQRSRVRGRTSGPSSSVHPGASRVDARGRPRGSVCPATFRSQPGQRNAPSRRGMSAADAMAASRVDAHTLQGLAGACRTSGAACSSSVVRYPQQPPPSRHARRGPLRPPTRPGSEDPKAGQPRLPETGQASVRTLAASGQDVKNRNPLPTSDRARRRMAKSGCLSSCRSDRQEP
jgi:hypothetical protein